MEMAKRTFTTILLAGSIHYAYAEEFLNYVTLSAAVTYTQATDNGLSVGDLLFSTDVNLDGGRRTVFLEPEYEGGYKLGLSYRVPHTKTHFFVNYDYFKDHEENTTFNVRNLGIAPAGAATTLGFARVEHHSEALQLGVSQLLNSQGRFKICVSGFFEHDRVSRFILENNANSTLTGHAQRETDNRFHGWGPGIGVRTYSIPFDMYPHWGLFVDASTTLFWGGAEFEQNFSIVSIGSTATVMQQPEQTHSLFNKVDIAAGFDFKGWLGTDYGKLPYSIELGVRYINIINAFKNGNGFFNPAVTNNVAFNGGTPINTSYANDWGRFGPFLQFNIGGMKA